MGRTIVVTGGAGYLGDPLVGQVLEDPGLDAAEVRVFDLAESPRAGDPRVRSIRGDLRDPEALRGAFAGADLVFHTAALVDWGRVPLRTLEAVNVGGTDNVLDACVAEAVPAVVHTSTLDVVYSGAAVFDGDETLPYPARYPNGYCRTKAEAERRAIGANGRPLSRPAASGVEALRTSVVRPCSIYGEGDPFHIGSLVHMARRGRLLRIGDGSSRSQFSYLGNVAHCHVMAARSLLSDEPRAAGEVFFATDFPAENFFDFLAPFVEAAGHEMPPADKALPRGPLYALGGVMEAVGVVTGPFGWRPTLTRFAIDFVTQDFVIESDKARRELGYEPRFSLEEAKARTVAWWRENLPAER